MDKLEHKLQEIKKGGRLGLMTHVVVGYPSLADTVRLVKIMAKEGVDIVELQIPFSDPLADGPTIMKACEKSLQNGTKIKDAFKVMQQLSREVSIPLLFMAYYNTVFRYKDTSSRVPPLAERGDLKEIASFPSTSLGIPRNDDMSGAEAFCKDAKAAGASGLIVPDVPIEEEKEEHFIKFCNKYDLANIRVISPSSTVDRLKKNAKVGSGFVYCTARQGITGARKDFNTDLIEYLSTVKKYFTIPLAVGFGISKPEHIKMLKGHADIAIVGSALIDLINRGDRDNLGERVSGFIKEIKVVD